MSGRRVGAWELLRKIGEGGMGTGFLARRADDEYRKQVAIKFVTLGRENQNAIERFRQERQILAGLEHPYIARLLDAGAAPVADLSGMQPYLVMEYVEGVAIHAYCAARHLTIQDRCRLFQKVCDAVAYAHSNLVIHRDLKPNNILVDPSGNPRLLDFGIAKMLDPESDGKSQATMLMGAALTPDYASPEQVRGRFVGTATDIYSLGAILYELLSGVRPHRFDSYTPQEVHRVVCELDPLRMSAAAPDRRKQLEGDLDAIVEMAMPKEPERRYVTVDQFSADIQRCVDHEPVIARQGAFQYRAAEFLRRNRAFVAAGALIAFSLIGGSAAATWQALRASREQARAEELREQAEENQRSAESGAKYAEEQRLPAEKNSRVALEQTAPAEARSREADLQRIAAETQKRLAEKRFAEVRKLAEHFLFDFHDAAAKLPGSTGVRGMLAKTALEYLDSLSRESASDPALKRNSPRLMYGSAMCWETWWPATPVMSGEPKRAIARVLRSMKSCVNLVNFPPMK